MDKQLKRYYDLKSRLKHWNAYCERNLARAKRNALRIRVRRMFMYRSRLSGQKPQKYTRAQVEAVLQLFEKGCVVCKSTEQLEMDHTEPLRNGGKHIDLNIQILCRSCHKKKSNEECRQQAIKELAKLEAELKESGRL